MRTTLADVFAAARECGCPIIHISRLAGEPPFIASSPCLSNASAPLLDITVDGYLGLMAELRNTLVVEHDECLSFPIFTGGGRDPDAFTKRLELPPRTTSGSLDLDCGHAAVYYLMDSVGQETTILYDGLLSFADIQSYWQRRGEIWRTFVESYESVDDDVNELSYLLDRTVHVDGFDVHAFATRRGLAPRSERIAS